MEFRWIRHGLVDSTSERAFAELAAGRARHGDVHLARGQTAGRGRLGRRWESPADEGLYLSVVLLPEPPAPPPAGLTMACAMAVRDGLVGLGLADVRVDWPNDLLVGAAKLCGILVESRGLDPARPHYVVGIGLNVRQRDFPRELSEERPVTSLALLGLELELERAARAVLAPLPRRLDQLRAAPDALAADFAAALGLLGQPVRACAAGATRRGVLAGLELERGLALRLADGSIERLPLAFVTRLERAAG